MYIHILHVCNCNVGSSSLWSCGCQSHANVQAVLVQSALRRDPMVDILGSRQWLPWQHNQRNFSIYVHLHQTLVGSILHPFLPRNRLFTFDSERFVWCHGIGIAIWSDRDLVCQESAPNFFLFHSLSTACVHHWSLTCVCCLCNTNFSTGTYVRTYETLNHTQPLILPYMSICTPYIPTHLYPYS